MHNPGRLLTATMRSVHIHLSAIALHHAAAGAFLSSHLRIGSHTGQRRSHRDEQQQGKHTELAETLHEPIVRSALTDLALTSLVGLTKDERQKQEGRY